MHRGYAKFWRKYGESDLWLAEPFTRGQAFFDMIQLANHKPGFFFVRGIRVDVKRGQLAWSEGALASRWKWSRGKVRRFFSMLEKEEKIVQQKNNITKLINIVKYEEYAGSDTTDGTRDGQQTVQETDNRRYTNKNDKNVKNDKNIILSTSVDSIVPETPEPSLPKCPQQEIINLWHTLLPELNQVKVWNEHSQKNLRARWREDPERQSLDWWKWFFENCIRTSSFLMGRKTDFQADLGWIVGPKNFAKIMNGKYRDRGPNTGSRLGDNNARVCEDFVNELQN